MRPSAIVNFERLFLLSTALGMAMLFLGGGGSSMGIDPTLLLGVGVVALAITVALVFWASRGRSEVARWLLAAVAAYGLLSSGFGIGQALAAGEPLRLADALGVLPVLMQGAAVALLFKREARGWFAQPGVVKAE